MRVLATAVIIVLALIVPPLHAQQIFGTIDLIDTTSASPGQGTGYVTWSSDRTTLSYRITYNNLAGAFSAAHFHAASNKGVLQAITFVGKTATGTWTMVDSVATLLSNEGVYVNIHTSIAPGGEIAGTIRLRQGGFGIALDGPQAGTASSGLGTGYAMLEGGTGTSDLAYRLTYAGLGASRSVAHFHTLPGGGVVHDLGTSFTDSTADGMWMGTPDSVIAKLFRGQVYANIHTSASPGGEIRGSTAVVGEFPAAGSLTPVSGVMSTALGTAWAILLPNLSVLYSATYQGLAGTYQSAHFHRLPSTSVTKAVTFANGHASDTWTGLTDQDVADFMAGRLYLNIHTSTGPSGEIAADMIPNDGMVMATLDGAQAGTASTARGSVWGVFAGDSMAYALTFTGLQGTYQSSHFHLAPAGTILAPITPAFNNTAGGMWDPGANFLNLLRGNVYVNIHSSTVSSGEIRGNLKLGSGTTVTGVERASDNTPREFSLSQNYPNPFNPVTTIEFALARSGRVTLMVYNVLGQTVATLVDGEYAAGAYRAAFDATKLTSGIYFYALSGTTGSVQTKRMLLVK